ncbi:MAG: hypothetical protein MUC84_11185 [Solirubrobacteraceae bacterium]|nr:hypothetical protein [Solirubrobacteraceae bacterium]
MRTFDLDPATTLRRARRERLVRRVLAALLVAMTITAAAGTLGPRTRTANGRAADGTVLRVGYEQLTRRGLSAPLTLEVERPGGFGDRPLRLAVSGGYFDIWDANAIVPEPAAQRAEGRTVVLEFDPPAVGVRFRARIDARIDPSFQGRRVARVALLDRDTPVASVLVTTRVLP